jgi:hypothetical protein
MIKYIIPSYQRPKITAEQTLNFLFRHGIPKNDIFLILRNDDIHLEEYKKIDEEINIITTDVKGIGMTHNFITDTFDENDFIIEIDDDLQELYDNERKPIKDFIPIVEEMKRLMEEQNISYGGTYQVVNPMFMSACNQYTTDLRYMLGCLRFRFIRKDIVVETNYAEDFENCIIHYLRDGKILKNNHIAPKTKNYQSGGCDGDGRHNDTERIDKQFLFDKYPQYCKVFVRKSGKTDLRLKCYKNVKVP